MKELIKIPPLDKGYDRISYILNYMIDVPIGKNHIQKILFEQTLFCKNWQFLVNSSCILLKVGSAHRLRFRILLHSDF